MVSVWLTWSDSRHELGSLELTMPSFRTHKMCHTLSSAYLMELSPPLRSTWLPSWECSGMSSKFSCFSRLGIRWMDPSVWGIVTFDIRSRLPSCHYPVILFGLIFIAFLFSFSFFMLLFFVNCPESLGVRHHQNQIKSVHVIIKIKFLLVYYQLVGELVS